MVSCSEMITPGINRDTSLKFCWRDIDFTVGSQKILSSVSGSVSSGELCCILGPSGAGKTSLLNLLSGRTCIKSSSLVGGEVSLNGIRVDPVSFRSNVGYVMQHDALVPTATPREALSFSARLRLGAQHEQQEQLVEAMLQDLKLSSCADTMIGGGLMPGISGGEAKRTSVGIELITQPRLLFLDEPTSGLDSESAWGCVSLLSLIAARGAAVLCTIHQPSSKVFGLFQRAVLMKSGRVLAQGGPEALIEQFSAAGHELPVHHNLADFVMDIAMNISNEELEAAGLFAAVAVSAATKTDDLEQLPALATAPERSAGLARQIGLLTIRELQMLARDPKHLTGRFGITIFLNLLFGTIFYGAGGRDRADLVNLQSHLGAISLATISSMFGTAQPVMLSFPLERPVFLREYCTGQYSCLAYFLSKSIVELPLAFIQALVQYIIIYFMLDLQGQFALLVIFAWGLGIASSSVAVLLGCSVPDVKTVAELAPAVFVPQFLFAGFFVRVDQIPEWLQWPQYLCSLKYALNLICLTEFRDCGNNSAHPAAAIANCDELLSQNSIEEDDRVVYILVLVILFLVFRILGAVILRHKARTLY